MGTICPKCDYERQPGDIGPDHTCPQCGIVYHKFNPYRQDRVSVTPGRNRTRAPASLAKEKAKNIAILAFVFLAGLLFAVTGYLDIREAEDSLAWPVAEGVITKSYVERKRSDSKSAGQQVIGSAKYTYSPTVRYRYDVAGRPYTGVRIGVVNVFKSGDHGRSWANSVVARYPVGKHVMVYFHPDTPAKAVLSPGREGTSALPLVLGLLAIVLSLAGMVFVARTRKSMWDIMTARR